MGRKLEDMSLEELWELFPITLSRHRDVWRDWYREEERRIVDIFPEITVSVNHIGSTAIDGIVAKPIVDILVEFPLDYDLDTAKEKLAEKGYICMSDEGRISLNKGYSEEGFAEKVFHVHLRHAGDNDELYFRDYMNDNPDLAKAYEKLKISLWKKYEHDRDAYTEGKTEFVTEKTAEARGDVVGGRKGSGDKVFTNYVSAMECWKGRVDSDTDYDAFRWHQWVKPLDLNKDEEVSEKSGFAFIGFCSEQGVLRNQGRLGTAAAPDVLRGEMANLPCTFSQDIVLYDAGNILCFDISLEEGQELLARAVEKILDLGLFPLILGGGHGTTFGHFRGHYDRLRKSRDTFDMGIVNFDAHFDLRPYNEGSSGTMFKQMADICDKDGVPYHYMPIGIQEHSNTVSLFKTAKALDVDYILAKDILTRNYADIIDQVDSFMSLCDSAYMTICADVFSSAFAPGVSATQSLGLDPEDVIPIIKHILRTQKVKGFDICEISPRFDQDNTTANLGAVIIFAVVSTLSSIDLL